MICHGKSKFTARKREELEKWLSNPEAQEFTVKLKEMLRGAKYPNKKKTDAYKGKSRIWVCRGTQKPIRILEENRNTSFYSNFDVISECPICHKPNSDDSFACCEEHTNQYLIQKKNEYKQLKSKQTKTSWERPEDRELRIKNNNGQHGPKEKHIWITNGIEDKCVPLANGIPDGYSRGRSNHIPVHQVTDEYKKHMSEHRRNSCYVWNDIVPCKEIRKSELDEYLKNGWNRGKKPGTCTSRKGIKQPKMVWVSKDGKALKIREADLEKYLQDGFHRGIK